ncbi:MAG: OB-fold domain-containing protein [Chloroflexi bacterium]|nr:OB-fold domain-containing protein [Chloroflexota bacterium]
MAGANLRDSNVEPAPALQDLAKLNGLLCGGCGQRYAAPAYYCERCGGTTLGPTELSSRGEVYSYTTIYVPPEGFEGEAPYDIAVIDLEDGVRATGRLGRVPDHPIDIGSRVEFVRADDRGLLFRPVW